MFLGGGFGVTMLWQNVAGGSAWDESVARPR